MADIKASEIAGELRKGERLYEVFRDASKVAAFFVDLEQKEAKLKKDISELEKDVKDLEDEMDGLVEKADKAVKVAQAEREQHEAVGEDAKQKAQEVLSKARQEATAIVSRASHEAQTVREHIAELQKEENGLQVVVLGLKNAQDYMIQEMQEKRDQLLKAFS